jgi:hypothetical protein
MTKKKTLAGSAKTAAKIKEKQQRPEIQPHQPTLQAMVWYQEEHYAALLAIFDDSHLLPPHFSDWLVRVEGKKAEVEARGDQVIKVYIDPATFPEWCEKKGLAKDANARAELALEVAQAHSFSL